MNSFIQAITEAAQTDGYWSDRANTAVEEAIDSIISRDGRETVIVSRHAGAVEWLRRQGIAGTVIEQATADDVAGKVVIGNLPMHLAAEAHQVGSIDLPGLAREQRGRDLTPEEMDVAGACVRWYIVAAVNR